MKVLFSFGIALSIRGYMDTLPNRDIGDLLKMERPRNWIKNGKS